MRETTGKRILKLAAVALVTVAVIVPATAMALGEFSDVPDDHTFASDIAWMAENGITDGCGSGLYCPADPVTRAQMSAFMKRLATLGVVDAATAVEADHAADSDLLEGKDTGEIAPKLSAEEDGITGSVLESNKGLVEVNAVTITVPEAGVLLISGTAFVDPDAVETDFILQTKVNGSIVGTPGWSAWFKPFNSTQSFELSYTVAEEVAAGTHTVTQLVGPRLGTSSFFHNHETLSVLFVPTGQAVFESSTASESATVVPSELGGDAD